MAQDLRSLRLGLSFSSFFPAIQPFVSPLFVITRGLSSFYELIKAAFVYDQQVNTQGEKGKTKTACNPSEGPVIEGGRQAFRLNAFTVGLSICSGRKYKTSVRFCLGH